MRILKIIAASVILIALAVGAQAQGTWSAVQSINVSGMTNGHMYYQYLLLNYTGTGTKSPILVYEHENSEGDKCYPSNPSACAQLTSPLSSGGSGVQDWFNNSAFQTRYCANGCIVVSVAADQTSDPGGETSNFGGYGDTPGSEPNERGVIAVIQYLLAQLNADPNRVYVTGDSLGGIGSQAIGLDYGILTGTQGHVITATMPFSGAVFRGGLYAPTNAQVAQIQGGGVQFDVNGTGDTGTSSNPTLWSEPLYKAIAGNTNYPGPPAGGRAGSSPMFFLLDTNLGHDVWDTYRPLPAGQPMLDILFAATASGGTTPTPPTTTSGAVLPSGYLSVSGNQVVGGAGSDVRMACSAYDHPTSSVTTDMNLMRTQGFNCAQVPWYDKTLCPGGTCSFTSQDAIVAAATASAMKVIFIHQSNEGVNGNASCTTQQANGLWYDVNGTAPWTATNGTDGCGTAGTVSYAQFKANSVALAKHYAGNSTVIGFDLHNEPTTFGNPACCATASNGTGTTGTGQFVVKNGQIYDPKGNLYIPVGINLDDSESQYAVTNAQGQPLTSLFPGINHIRLVTHVTNNEPLSASATYPSPTSYDAIVNALTPLGIVVEIEDHDCNGGYVEYNTGANASQYCALPQPGSAALTPITNFYASLATHFASNPYVWVGTMNEPCSDSSCDYGSPIALISNYQQAVYNAVRGTGSKMMIQMLAGLGGGNCQTVGAGFGFNASLYAPMTNIIWELHSYATGQPSGNNGQIAGSTSSGCGYTAAQTIQSADGVVPVIFGEWGSGSGSPNSTDAATIAANMVAAAKLGYGDTGWAWYPSTQWQMANNGDGGGTVTLTTWGQEMASVVAQVAPLSGGGGGGTTVTIGANWNSGNGGDLKAMVEDTGAAVEAADPGALIMVEGILNNGTLFNGTARGSTALPITAGSIGDLSTVGSVPVTCCSPRVVYAVHDMPTSVSAVAPDSGTAATTMRNTAWGYLVTGNKAPVWVGKAGASLDNTNSKLSDENAWAAGLTQYLNGSLGGTGGPTFSGCQQPMGSDWYTYGNLAGSSPDGTLNPDGSTKSGQQAVWGTLLYTVCNGPTAPTGVTAMRVNDLMNTFGMNTQVQSYGSGAAYTNGAGMIADLNYIGIRVLRDGDNAATSGAQLTAMTALANAGFRFTILPTITGNANPYTFSIASRLPLVKTIDALASPHALLDVEMFNEPINWGVTYSPCGTGAGGQPWTCVAQADAAYYTAIKADSQVGSLPVWSVTRVGDETPNVGLQYLTIPSGTTATLPAGTQYADAFNMHIYPFYNGAVGMIDPGSGIVGNAHDQMAFQMGQDFVTTYVNSYPGQPLTTIYASPHVMTEFGLSTTGQVDARTKAVNTVNGFLDAYFVDGFARSFAYELYEEGDGYGFETTTNTPTTVATYMHNFTADIADTGATAATFTPGSLVYSMSNLPANSHAQLLQRSAGDYLVVVWADTTNYNLTSHAPITISPTTVTLTLGTSANVTTYDITSGTTPIATVNGVLSTTASLSDHVIVFDVSPTGQPCVSNCGTTSATTWNPSDISSNLTLTNSNQTATLASAGTGSVRSTTSYTTGKVCADIAATSISPNWDVGISSAGYALNVGGGLGVDTNGIGFDPNSTGANQGIFYNNAVLSSGASPSVTGDVATICADFGTKLMWVSDTVMRAASDPWNNSASATPATETGGLSFSGITCPCFLTFNANESGASATMNPTGPLAVSLPTGFSDWQAATSTATNGHPIVLILGN